MKSDRKMVDSLDESSTKRKLKRPSVIVGGVRYALHQDPRSKVWRVRKRTKDVQVDVSLGVVNLKDAETKAKETLGKEHDKKTRLSNGAAFLREIADVYLKMPKRCSEEVAEINVKRWGKILEVAWGSSLEDTRASRLGPELWEDYAAKRHKELGLKGLDLSTRRTENRGINSAIRMAVSIFHEGLEQSYKRAGIGLDFESIRKVQWLPEIKMRLPTLAKSSVADLMKALPALKITDRPMWRAIMIARFSGLRSGEISAARPSWLIKNDAGAWCFEVRDRPEERYWHKTGEDYTAPILSPELVKDLRECPDGELLVPVDGNRPHFFKRLCNNWLRQFIPRPNKGMHRLRALYAEALKNATANAVMAEQAGVEAARKALGHTSKKTTEKHYLPKGGAIAPTPRTKKAISTAA